MFPFTDYVTATEHPPGHVRVNINDSDVELVLENVTATTWCSTIGFASSGRNTPPFPYHARLNHVVGIDFTRGFRIPNLKVRVRCGP